jgi:hypothetical protein
LPSLPFYFLLSVGGFEVIDDFLGEDVEISNITPAPLSFALENC